MINYRRLAYWMFPVLIISGFIFWAGKAYTGKGQNAEFLLHVSEQNLLPGEERYIEKRFLIPVATYITTFLPEIAGGDFSLLHHANLAYTGMKDYYCKDLPFVFYATGNEVKKIDSIYPGYGIPVSAKKEFILAVHFSNESTGVKAAEFSLRLRGVKSAKATFPVFLTIGDYCRSLESAGEYAIPGGVAHSETRMYRPFIMPKSGKLLAWGGHIHEYGSSLQLWKNGAMISELFPDDSLRPPGAATTSVFLKGHMFDEPLFAKRGEVLDMAAVYDKPYNLFYPGAMGVAGLFFDFDE